MTQFVNFNFCRCCLNEEKANQTFVDMKNEAIVFKNLQTSFYDCYFEISGCSIEDFLEIPVAQCKICPQCLVTLKTAHVFRQICQETSHYLKRQFAVLNVETVAKIEPNVSDNNVHQSMHQQVVLIAVNPQGEIKLEPERAIAEHQQAMQLQVSAQPTISSNASDIIGPDEPMDHHNSQETNLLPTTSNSIAPPKAVFPCTICPDTSFTTKARLTVHMKKKHTNKEPTTTSSEGHTSSEADMFEHLTRNQYSTSIPIQATKSTPNRMKYYCPHCSHSTSSRDMLTNHLLVHTQQVINFDCNLCGKKFLNAGDFKCHISEAHTK